MTKDGKKPVFVSIFLSPINNYDKKYKGILKHTCGTVCYNDPQKWLLSATFAWVLLE
jgi:hypothetical protein